MTDAATKSQHDAAITRRPALVALLSCAVVLVSAGWVILADVQVGRGSSDQINYHEPTVRAFAMQWPRADLSNYWSATTPGYHLFIAAITRDPHLDRRLYQAIGLIFSLGLVVTLGFWLGSRAPPALALACTLGVALSLYVFNASAWLLPDNAAWWGVLGMLLLALRPRFDARTLAASAVVLVALVSIRQIHLWSAGVLWAAAWLGSSGTHPDTLLAQIPRRIPRTLLAIVVCAPALALVLYFMDLWDGLIVPRYQYKYHGWNPATPAFFLSILGAFSVFYLQWLVGPLRTLWRDRRWLVLAALAGGALVALIPETSYSTAHYRYSGLWNLVKASEGLWPEPLHRTSPIIVALSTLGALALSGWTERLNARDRWIVLGAVFGFVAAQTTSPAVWQRYHEPFVLILLAVMACRTASGLPRRSTLGPALLALALAGVTTFSIARSPEAQMIPYDPREELHAPPPGRSGPERGIPSYPHPAPGAPEEHPL